MYIHLKILVPYSNSKYDDVSPVSLYLCVFERLGPASSVGSKEVLGHDVVIVGEFPTV